MNAKNHIIFNCARQSNPIFYTGWNFDKTFFTILYSLFLVFSLISFIWDMNILIKINALLGVFAFIFFSVRIKREYAPIYAYIGILIASFLVSSFFVERTGWRFFTPVIFILSSLGPAIILLKKYVYSWGGYVVFYSLAGYFLILMLSGVDGNSALKFCSFNGISIVMLVACISLYIILSMEKKRLDLKPALITLIISIWGIGRSGIIASVILLFGLLFVRLRIKKAYVYIGAICLAVFLTMIYLHRDVLLEFSQSNYFLKNAIDHYLERGGGWDPVRTSIWTNYFNNLDIFRVIFGVNAVTDPWPAGKLNEYNYHNSFINLHSQTGLMGLFTLSLIIIAVFKFYKTNKVFFVLLLVLIIRSSTDLIIFFGRFDFIPFFFIFFFLQSKLVEATGENKTNEN